MYKHVVAVGNMYLMKKNLFCWWQIKLWCKLFHHLHKTPNYRWLGEMKISENLDIMYGQIFQNFS